MSVDMFLKLKANGSDVVGDSSSKIFKGWIEVESFSWGVQTSRDAGGLATGRRSYKEFRWVNRHQKSSLLIWKALILNQPIEAEFDVVRASSDGGSEVFFKFLFTAGSSITVTCALNPRNASAAKSRTTTKFVLIYCNSNAASPFKQVKTIIIIY